MLHDGDCPKAVDGRNETCTCAPRGHGPLEPPIGAYVQWENGKAPLGRIVHKFEHKGQRYAVVEKSSGLAVVRIYERLLVVG